MDVQELTLREKVLQTVIIRVDKDHFVNEQVGAAFFFGEIITEADEMGIEQARKTLAQYIDNAKIPILITSDFENGCGSMLKGLTPLPYLMSLGATNSAQLAYDYGHATALEARSVGANWSFSPVVDLNINDRNPLVNVRGIGDDPEHAIRLLKEVIRGMQDHGLAACAKHFPGDGVDYRDQHIVTTHNTLSMEEWREKSGRVFKELIDAGVYSVMAGHISLPAYQSEDCVNDINMPATLSYELITNLLKNELGFDGVVVTDALDMGGYLGWYESKRRAQIESFKAGCDMMLWPTDEFVDDLIEAVECGYVSMERLDDAVSRILAMKRKLGLFDQDNHAKIMSEEDKDIVSRTQQEVAENSVTLIKDKAGFFPLNTKKHKRIAVIPVTHYEPAFCEAQLLCKELNNRGFIADYIREPATLQDYECMAERYDVLMYALMSRPFRPIGFLDFMGAEAMKVANCGKYGIEKTMVVSFGSPYFGEQYFERIPTYVNAYSMLTPSVKAFVRAATGEIPFTNFSPVSLK